MVIVHTYLDLPRQTIHYTICDTDVNRVGLPGDLEQTRFLAEASSPVKNSTQRPSVPPSATPSWQEPRQSPGQAPQTQDLSIDSLT